MKYILIIVVAIYSTTILAQVESYSELNTSYCPKLEVSVSKESTYKALEIFSHEFIDTDGDGLQDKQESSGDCDGDGLDNIYDMDSDNDGVLDGDDKCVCERGENPDGCINDEKRLVFWLHGYSGNDKSMDHAAEDVANNYQVFSNKLDYSAHQESFSLSSERVEEQIRGLTNSTEGNERNFVIAHSLGGIVMRVVGELRDDEGTKLYNGLVTIGACHQGAKVADNLINEPEKLVRIVAKACRCLSEGPVLEGVQNNFYGSLIPFGFLGAVFDDICDQSEIASVLEIADPIIFTGIEDQLTTDNVQSLPTMPTDHRAVFYGTEIGFEDGTYSYRFFGGLPLVSDVTDDYGPYEAEASDQAGIDYFNQQIDWFEMKIEEYSLNASPTDFDIILDFIINATNYSSIRQGYRKGLAWINDFDLVWRDLIGATTISIDAIGCNCYEIPDGQTIPNELVEVFIQGSGNCTDIDGPYTGCYPVFEMNLVNEPGDGFILAESASNGPGANYPPVHMPGSNHYQMRNDNNTKEAVRKIFDLGLGGNYFKTDK